MFNNKGSKFSSDNIINFGNYYFPNDKVKKDLKEIIIFTENTVKRSIPNGSVLVYQSDIYNPEILSSDIGCGISSVITEGIDFNNKTRRDILKAVNEIGIHIGQGNHFLDFTVGHPSYEDRNINSNMIYLHSDFNSENVIPKDYFQAKDFEEKSKEKRIEYLEKLTRILGISSRFYRDWTHNSVNKDKNLMIYRKGAINLKENDGVGALALNPLDGICLYVSNFDKYHSSMQHGLGRIGSKGNFMNSFVKESEGMARGYSLHPSKITSQIEQNKNEAYNSINKFIDAFGQQQSLMGMCVPEFVITTKN